MLRVSGSLNADGPAYTSLQGEQEVCPWVTPQSTSKLRFRSTPSQAVPGLSRRFLRHIASTVMEWTRPSGFMHGTSQRSSASRISLMSDAAQRLPP